MYATVIKRLVLLSAFCFALELYRLSSTGNAGFIFLPFNLILAWILVAFALLANHTGKRWLFALCFTAWLVFFPNSPYIITDMIHLKPRAASPYWFDTAMLYTFAFTGLLVGVFSALIIYRRLKQFTGYYTASGIMLLAMLASGYGIYLGRVLRWNSWNLLTHPTGIWYDTLARITDPFMYPRTYGMTLLFGILLWLVFLVFESFTTSYQTNKTTTL